MRAAMDTVVLLLIVALSLCADGLADCGVLVPTGMIVLAVAELLHSAAEAPARAKRKPPCTPADQSRVQRA